MEGTVRDTFLARQAYKAVGLMISWNKMLLHQKVQTEATFNQTHGGTCDATHYVSMIAGQQCKLAYTTKSWANSGAEVVESR